MTPLDTRRQPSAIAKWIRRISIPIVLGWLALLFLLNTVVPQLEEVGKAHDDTKFIPRTYPQTRDLRRRTGTSPWRE